MNGGLRQSSGGHQQPAAWQEASWENRNSPSPSPTLPFPAGAPYLMKPRIKRAPLSRAVAVLGRKLAGVWGGGREGSQLSKAKPRIWFRRLETKKA